MLIGVSCCVLWRVFAFAHVPPSCKVDCPAHLPPLPAACCPQKHEEEQRLVELQRQLQELERAEHKLTTEAEELGLDAAEVRHVSFSQCLFHG